MKIAVNLNAVKELEAMPEGIYPVRVDKVENAMSKESKQPMLAIEAAITSGEFMGRAVFINLSLQEKALWKTKGFCEAAGISWTDDGFDSDDLIGAELRVQLGVKLYENKPRNEVLDFFKLS